MLFTTRQEKRFRQCMTKLDEKEIIGIFANKLGISNLDDVALLDKGIVIKSDMLVASTDVPPGMKAWQVARKSVVSCIQNSNKKWSQSWRLCHRIRRIWTCSCRPSNPAAAKRDYSQQHIQKARSEVCARAAPKAELRVGNCKIFFSIDRFK